MSVARRWGAAWRADDFYRHHEPQAHFDTLVRFSPILAQRLAAWLDETLAEPFEVIDLGADQGTFLTQVLTASHFATHGHGIDLRMSPPTLDPNITWHQRDVLNAGLPHIDSCGMTVLLAHEFFDDVPCDVVEVDERGVCRWLDRGPDGSPLLADVVTERDTLDWLDRWWPPQRPAMRMEVGIARDRLWHALLRSTPRTLGIVIDYGHVLRERMVGTWDGGTLIGYRQHAAVSPRLDGTTNITAHVAIDALAAQSASAQITRLREWIDAPPDASATGALGDFHVLISRMS